MIKGLTLRRLALLLGGVALLSLGGAFFSCSGLGMDPLSVLYSGIAALTKLKLGTALFAANAVFLILLFFHKQTVLDCLNAFRYGHVQCGINKLLLILCQRLSSIIFGQCSFRCTSLGICQIRIIIFI